MVSIHLHGIGTPGARSGRMPKFNVLVREVHIAIHEAEADTPEEALRMVNEGKTSEIAMEYSHQMSEDTWTVDDEEGNCVRDQV